MKALSTAVRPPSRQAGFSLLEAIVAMTVMAMALLSLYSWLSSSTIALNRVHAQSQALQDARTALAFIETVNPMLQPNGNHKIEDIDVRWSATPVADRRSGRSRAGSVSYFDMGLYQLDVTVIRDSRTVKEFRVRRAGWEAVRSAKDED